jgi:uncharacterized protein
MSLLTKNKIAIASLILAFAESAIAQGTANQAVVKPAPVAAKAVYSQDLRDAILAQRWADARPQLEELVAAGDLTASVTLATLLVRGIDGQKDTKRSEKMLVAAAGRGSEASRHLLAQFYFKGDFNKGTPEYSKAWNYIYPMAEANDPMGLYLGGKIIRDGLLGSANERVGREMILNAAMRGWPDAQIELSGTSSLNLNNESAGVDEKDLPVTPLNVLTKSAAKGNADSMWQLGLINLFGIGVSQDTNQAKQWFVKGQARGDAAAMVLVWYFANEAKATEQLTAALKKAPARAAIGYTVIARQLLNGAGIASDPEKSAFYALIGGQLNAPDSFGLIAEAKKKLSSEKFASAEIKFRQWRTENALLLN